MNIVSTKKYSQFKNILGNRQLSKEHIHALSVEIQRNNLLEVCPVIVNEKMEVIDGQHRLEAAKRLGIPVPYVKVSGLGIEHVVRMNTSQKKWMMKDYVRLHMDLGNQHYIDLNDFVEEHKLSLHQGIGLLSNQSYNTSKVNDFREGRWEITSYDRAIEVVEVMKEMRPKMRTTLIYRNEAFSSAVVKTLSILEKNGESADLLVEKTKAVPQSIDFSHRVRDYLKQLEEIINFGKGKGFIRLV